MALDAETAVALALVAFDAAPGQVVYVDREPRGPGVVDAGDLHATVDEPAALVFRDELPGADWRHPCAYALVEISTRQVVAVAASVRPPQLGPLPDSWLVATDPDGRADLVRHQL